MAFSELIKDFSKIRDYMRDFYIYGFKSRNDFHKKSPRTYDDEKRRIESYLNPYAKWKRDKRGKNVYLSLDTGQIPVNPLYNAWKAKSFTDNDISLHFSILSALKSGEKNISEITDSVCKLTGEIYDVQTVRLKANEYVKEGLLEKEKVGRADYYKLSKFTLSTLPVNKKDLTDAFSFFQGTAPFGFIGSTLLDLCGATNNHFKFKHYYIVHTLEDGILLEILEALKEKKFINIKFQGSRGRPKNMLNIIPLKIFVSSQTGRRYLACYSFKSKRFQTHRLDYIREIQILEECPEYDDLKAKLENAKTSCWGVTFGGKARSEELKVTLFIDEKYEQYILDRLKREGRGGTVERMGENTYQYSISVFDSSEMMAWIKTFTGRIIKLEGTNKAAINMFYKDMRRMNEMYCEEI